ncbi:type VII secretion protein EccCb [Streptomyces sp. NPDC002514]|uniref:type VII secretion protein EccCb n=1 Tax=Streptomyces sp. NPDC001270 TaxID=3364554 RepID=UPI00367FEF69
MSGAAGDAAPAWQRSITSPNLDQLLPPLEVSPTRGLTSRDYFALGRLVVPVGIVHVPFELRCDIHYLDLSGNAGHVLVVGGKGSGKSTLLTTLVTSLAVTHTPSEVQFYCLDGSFSGQLVDLIPLPHVGSYSIVMRNEDGLVRQTLTHVQFVLDRRPEVFLGNRINSISEFRAERTRGHLASEPYGDVFLVIDDWETFSREFSELVPAVVKIAQRGNALGIHLLISATTYGKLPPELGEALQTRLELKLDDASESQIDPQLAQNIPAGEPGRGLTPEKQQFLAGLPRIDTVQEGASGADGLTRLANQVSDAWQGDVPLGPRTLPKVLNANQLPKDHIPSLGLAIGIEEWGDPAYINFDTDPHFVIFGDGQSGKTSLLRLIMKKITERYTPERARFVIGDYRRSLMRVAPDSYEAEYAAMPAALESLVPDICAVMKKRMPGPEVTPQELHDRSWWSGPELFLIVDDFDLVATASGNPLHPLTEYLPYSKELGLHLIIARRCAGAGRSMYEPMMLRLKELDASGIVLSGQQVEGQLLGGVTPTQLPPGRGVLIIRNLRTSLVQTAWLPLDSPAQSHD